LDLGLLQREVALQIGVDPITVLNWEKGKATPSLKAIPEVIQFLGHDPRPEAGTFPEQIRQFRRRLGLSIDKLAERIGVDRSTLQKWERLGYRPRPRLYARLIQVLGLPAATGGAEATFGERLRAARLRAGMTQREMGKRIGVGQQVVSSWESGKSNPAESQQRQIGAILEVKP
jgi:transcriptional regulator with XRE-family HTH domain